MNLKEWYIEHKMRGWQSYYYEKTGKPLYFWWSVLMDVAVLLFAIYFIYTMKTLYSSCIQRMMDLNPGLRPLEDYIVENYTNITRGLAS